MALEASANGLQVHPQLPCDQGLGISTLNPSALASSQVAHLPSEAEMSGNIAPVPTSRLSSPGTQLALRQRSAEVDFENSGQLVGEQAHDEATNCAREQTRDASSARKFSACSSQFCQWTGDPLLQLRDVLLQAIGMSRPEIMKQLRDEMDVIFTTRDQLCALKRAQFLLYSCRLNVAPTMGQLIELRLIELTNMIMQDTRLQPLWQPCAALLRHGTWGARAAALGMQPDDDRAMNTHAVSRGQDVEAEQSGAPGYIQSEEKVHADHGATPPDNCGVPYWDTDQTSIQHGYSWKEDRDRMAPHSSCALDERNMAATPADNAGPSMSVQIKP